MSLRAKLIAVFALFGVAPIVALGVFTYVRSMQAVEDLVATRTSLIAERAAQEIRDRYTLRESDLLLLAENAETQRLYRALIAGDGEGLESARRSAHEYLRRAWEVFGDSYRWVQFRDHAGVRFYELGESDEARTLAAELPARGSFDVLVVTQPIRDIENGDDLGTLTAAIRLHALLPDEALSVAFGRAGYSAVLDRSSGRVLYHPSRAVFQQPLASLLGPGGWNVGGAALSGESGSFAYKEDNSSRVASFATLATPPWTIVASASVAEFAPPFARTRSINLLIVVLAAVAISVAFLLVTRRLTHSLGVLTAAADQVAQGDFAPQLPPRGGDEVGRLATAFALMVQQVHDMLRRIQESRHMAAIGQFASQLSHEIRNPLTSIKLNLQGLEREVDAGRIANQYAGPIGISLREVNRLNRVAGGVLSIARKPSSRRDRCSVHAAVSEAMETVRQQLQERGIEVRMDLNAADDVVRGDAEQLRGVFLNLFLNACDVMPDGGLLEVASDITDDAGDRASKIRIQVADSGPGVPLELREKIFEPFFSTKDTGTGFGLALAQQTVEEQDGTLKLEPPGGATHGAVFAVELPLDTSEQAK
jgi:signal transduction histidine kinase